MQITKIQELARWDAHLEKVRDAVKGSMFVKAKREEYLPNPSNITEFDLLDEPARAKYAKSYSDYLSRAEFDDFTGQTLRVMVGKLGLSKMMLTVPERINYLTTSADGDGLTYRGLIENTFQNVAQAKFHIVLTHYAGVNRLPENPSKKAVNDAKLRVVFKEYARESVFDYDFTEVNGITQLSLLVLRQVSTLTEKTNDGFSKKNKEEFLILGLNENGNYYQQLIEKVDGDQTSNSGEIEVIANKSKLKFIPVFIASDEELTTGTLPQELGFLSSISDMCYHRYNVSAKRKTALWKFDPTLFVKNMTMESFEETKKINGRSSIEMCGVNVLATSDGAQHSTEVELLSPAGSLSDYHIEDEKSLDKLRMLGASVDPKDKSNSTATEANIEASKQNAFLNPAVDCLERMTKALFLYAGIFEGLWTQEDLELNSDKIEVKMNRDFAQKKGSAEEVGSVVNLYASLLIDKLDAIKMLIDLGWQSGDAQEILDRMELSVEE
jgi:hypothetical protein